MDTIQYEEDRLSGMIKNNNRHSKQRNHLDFYQLFIGLTIVSLILLFPAMILAQDGAGTQIEMADAMRANGKIYVVVLVIGILFTGLLAFAIRTDSKVSKLEKEVKKIKISEEL